MEDVASWVVVSDRSSVNGQLSAWAEHVAQPDMCALNCSECCYAEPCNPDCFATFEQIKDPNYMNSKARHLGGSNLGFADGHAAWFKWVEIMKRSTYGVDCFSGWETPDNSFRPLYCHGFTSEDPEAVETCGSLPPLW
jgi:prepilin-type processing-associated H-X9-DG protein